MTIKFDWMFAKSMIVKLFVYQIIIPLMIYANFG